MLGCTETVTVIRGTGTGYTCQSFAGCSWYEKAVVSMEGSGIACADMVKVRFPSSILTGAVILPQTGDHIVRGVVSSVTTASALHALHPRRIMSVGDNRRGRFPHLAVIAQ